MYASSAGIHDRYAGSREAALRMLRAAFSRGGTTASAEVVLVAHLDGRVAGMAAAFPMGEATERSARFLWVTLSRVPPWRWVRTVRVFRQGAAAAAPPPPGS